MKLRIFTEPQQGASYEQLRAVARCAEECGFDAFFRSDHYLRMGAGDPRPGPTERGSHLGLACDTSRIRLGTLVTAATFRLPGTLGRHRRSGGRHERRACRARPRRRLVRGGAHGLRHPLPTLGC